MNEVLKLQTKMMLANAVSQFSELMGRNVRVSFSQENLRKLEENELFAQATKEGFSKETLRQICVPFFDNFIKQVDMERIKGSITMQFVKGRYPGKIDLEAVTGAYIFDLMDSKGLIEKCCEPEFKKAKIFAEACKLTVNKGNISFNTALKRTIAFMESEDYISSKIEEGKKTASSLWDILNPLIEFYLENEMYFLVEMVPR